MNFRLLLACLVVTSVLSGAETLSLAQVLRDVSAQHPQVRAAQALAQAERERIPQASAWENTTVGVEIMRADTLRPYHYSEIEWSVSQKLPLTAQRRRRVDLAKADATVAESNVSARVTPLLIQATDAFYHLVHARELLELTKRSDEILIRAVSAAQARLADGGASVSSVLLAETERVRLQEQLISHEREIAQASTLLNTLRNLPPEAPIPPLDVSAGHSMTPIDSFEALRERALAHRPELRAAEAKVTAADRATDMARSWLPDPEVTLRARTVKGNREPISEYDTGIAFSVPWFNRGKYRAGVRESERRREAAELDVAAMRSQTVAEMRDAWIKFQAATQSVALYEQRLAPLAERSLEAASTGLDSGKTGILELVAAQKNLRDVHNALAVARADRARAVAVLGAMTGQNLLLQP
ncbi:MAG TPA: TolC family protein [Opitutaceae bacterium]|nr:TolC family protein [Opitutaceae bacterium]